MNGWFPHFSPSGDHLLTGTRDLWIDKTQSVGFGYQGVPSATRGWFNETTAMFVSSATSTDVGLSIWSCRVGGTKQPLGIVADFRQLVVDAGRWAGWGTMGIRTSWGQTITANDPRAPILSQTHFGYLLDGSLATQRLVVDGVTIDTAPIIDPMMSEQGVCWVRWTAGARVVYGKRLDVPGAIASVRASDEVEYQAIPIDTPGGPWILSYDASRLILRPWGDTDGYIVATGETMSPMGVWHVASGMFRIGWSSPVGIYAEAYVDPSGLRVDLGGTSTPSEPGETLPGAPGSTPLSATLRPPMRHPLTDASTGLVSKPWAAFFEAVAEVSATNIYSYVPANTLLGRGAQGPGPASVLALGSGLTIRDDTLIAE